MIKDAVLDAHSESKLMPMQILKIIIQTNFHMEMIGRPALR